MCWLLLGWLLAAPALAAPRPPSATQALIDSVLNWQYSPRLPEGIRLLEAELRRCRQAGRVADQLQLLNSLAWLAWQQADYVHTDQWALQSVRLGEQYRGKADRADPYYTLAMSAFEQQEPDRALRFLRRLLAFPRRGFRGEQTRYMQALATIGQIYLEKNQPRAAQPYLRRALAEARRVREPVQEFSTLAAWAAGLRRSRPDTARTLAEQALRLARTRLANDDNQASAITYAQLVLMQVAQQQQRWPDALALSRQVAAGARRDANREFEAEALTTQAQALRALGQPAAAYDTLARTIALTDTLRSRAKAEELARTQARLGAVEQQARIRALEQQRRIAALQADRARTRSRELLALAAGLGALLLGAAYAYWRLRRSRAALARSEARATAANATKDRLMGIIGHDLRAPVASLQQALLLVRHYADHPDPAEQRTLATDLHLRAQGLSGLLDNLLFWGSGQRDEVRNHPERIGLPDHLRRVVALYQPLADAKGLRLLLDLPADPLPTAWADPMLLDTVLRNLVGNALKFTPTGGEVRVEARPDPTGRLRLCVRDTGVGLTPDQLAHLFDVRAHRSTPGTAREPGTGLGLLVSRQFAALLGGELTVESRPGEGATFAFTVAVAEAVAPAAGTPA